jgi:hypothetical protein
MKKVVLFSLLVVFSLCIVSVPEAAQGPMQSLNEDTVFPLEIDFGQMMPGPIPHCGDYCETPGQGRGCVDTSGSNWVKTPCTCTGGVWTC